MSEKHNDPRIAPFPFEKTSDPGHLKAYLNDIEKAVKQFCRNHHREVPPYVDVRGGVSYWFKEMNVMWDGEPVFAGIEDSEGSPWVIEWDVI